MKVRVSQVLWGMYYVVIVCYVAWLMFSTVPAQMKRHYYLWHAARWVAYRSGRIAMAEELAYYQIRDGEVHV